MSTPLTESILTSLKARADSLGDHFQVNPKSPNRISIKCFRPDEHQNGDAHPSALYYLDKYVFCKVCGFKERQKKLAERLGIGAFEGGLTLEELAKTKGLPLNLLQAWGWRTQVGKDKRAKVLIPWYDEERVKRTAPAYHVRRYIDNDDGIGPRFTWDIPKDTKLRPYGA